MMPYRIKSQSESARRSLGAEAVISVVDIFGRTNSFVRTIEAARLFYAAGGGVKSKVIVVSVYANVLIACFIRIVNIQPRATGGLFLFRTKDREQVAVRIPHVRGPHRTGNLDWLPSELYSLIF